MTFFSKLHGISHTWTLFLRLKDRKNSIFGKIFILLYLQITCYRDMQLTCVSIYQYRSSYIIKHWPAGNFTVKNESIRAYFRSIPRGSSIKRITRLVSQNLPKATQLTATTSKSKTAMSRQRQSLSEIRTNLTKSAPGSDSGHRRRSTWRTRRSVARLWKWWAK